MASNSEWKEDNQLENDLRKYVRQNFKRSEILDFVRRDFPEYTRSTATLDRRLRHFGIYYINYDTPVAAVSDAVQKELEEGLEGEGGGGVLIPHSRSFSTRILHPALFSSLSRIPFFFPRKLQ